MAVVFTLFFRDDGMVGIFVGLLMSGPLYLAFGFVLAKFGYQRKSWKQLRSEPRPDRSSAGEGPAGAPKPKPPPTRRTGGTAGRPGGARKKRR